MQVLWALLSPLKNSFIGTSHVPGLFERIVVFPFCSSGQAWTMFLLNKITSSCQHRQRASRNKHKLVKLEDLLTLLLYNLLHTILSIFRDPCISPTQQHRLPIFLPETQFGFKIESLRISWFISISFLVICKYTDTAIDVARAGQFLFTIVNVWSGW